MNALWKIVGENPKTEYIAFFVFFITGFSNACNAVKIIFYI